MISARTQDMKLHSERGSRRLHVVQEERMD